MGITKEKSLIEIAHERAASRYPPPAYEPTSVGIGGASVAGAVLIVFGVFSGIDSDRHPTALGATIALGFLVPFLYLKLQDRRHSAEALRIYNELLNEKERLKVIVETPLVQNPTMPLDTKVDPPRTANKPYEPDPVLLKIASEEAAVNFPPPAYSALDAGLAGACLSAVIVGLVLFFFGTSIATRPLASIGTICIGFLVPFLYFHRQQFRFARESTAIYMDLANKQHAEKLGRPYVPSRRRSRR